MTVDPRTKLILTVLFTILIFIIDVLPVAAIQMAVFIILCLVLGIRSGHMLKLQKIAKNCALLLPLILVLIALQIFFGKGMYRGVMLGCRIISLSILIPMLTMTGDMQHLAHGLTGLGLNYTTAFIITSALNLIPAFEEEARLILDARRLRSPQVPRKHILHMNPLRITEYPAIALPLMIRAMRQAQMTGLAMDSRAFGAFRSRTWLREIKFSIADFALCAAGIVWATAAIAANILLSNNA